MNYKNKYAQKFYDIMEPTVKKWKGYESHFYDKILTPICVNDPLLRGLLSKGKEGFPHNLWLVWVYSWEWPFDMTIEELEQAWQSQHYVFTIAGNSHPVVKGKSFENTLAQRVVQDTLLQRLAAALPGKLAHVGNANKREDFVLTDEYSIDIKYSGLQNDDRFKNIIKPWGNDSYSATNKIQEGILRSMYKEGASQGLFLPKATGRTVHHGIFKYNAKTGFDDVKQDDYTEYGFGPIPSLRKNILYLYNDDGYWASHCLMKVITWAANHLEELGFTDYTRDKNYTSYSPEVFWGFSSDNWAARQTWYGK